MCHCNSFRASHWVTLPVCDVFSGAGECGAERSHTEIWRRQWVCVWGGSNENTAHYSTSLSSHVLTGFMICFYLLRSVPLSPPLCSSLFLLVSLDQVVWWFCVLHCENSAGGNRAALSGKRPLRSSSLWMFKVQLSIISGVHGLFKGQEKLTRHLQCIPLSVEGKLGWILSPKRAM